MRDRTVALVWVGGVLLAAAVYAVGPDAFVRGFWLGLDGVDRWCSALLAEILARGYDVIRAVAIALYAVALLLGLIGLGRGQAAMSTVVWTSVLFLLLGWWEHWLLALAVAAVAAAGLTRRLTSPPGRPPRP